MFLTLLFVINAIVFEETKTPNFFYENTIASICYMVDVVLIVLWVLNEVTSQRPTYPVPLSTQLPKRKEADEAFLLNEDKAVTPLKDICDIA